MRWYVKCCLDDLKALVPAHDALRRYKRKVRGYRAPAPRADFAIAEGLRMIQFIRSSRSVAGARCLEVGAGWEPLLPILFSLAGARSVIMTDLNRLCDDQTFDTAMASLRRNEAVIAEALPLSLEKLRPLLEWRSGGSMEEGLRRFGIDYMAPCDCAKLPLPDTSIDIVYSRDALEHIPGPVIDAIFHETRRVLAADGVACHFIDPSDHWEHGDKGISRINFLRYSDALFRLTYVNRLNYHNRLRHSEYVHLLREGGYAIVKEEHVVDRKSLAWLEQVTVAPRYRSFDAEDLATVDSFFLARPALAGGGAS